jgi:predicted amidohydrolase
VPDETAADKEKNIEKAKNMIDEAALNCASVIALGEMFNCPYQNSYFPKFAENISGGETVKMLKKAALDNEVYIIGGSIPEEDGGIIYNTSCIFGPDGNLIAKHRKVHLFDVELENITFKESDTLGRGSGITVFDTEFCRMGVAICYDVRFPELIRLMALDGAEVIVIPASFNMTTGPAHWEMLFRTRAVDNQIYMAGASPARDEKGGYVSYGNSIVVSPWGDIVSRAGYGEEIIYSELDGSRIKNVRDELPLLKHRRTDLYEVVRK